MKSKIILEDVDRILSSEDIPWNLFSGKNVLVTGANGMLPGYLVDTLLRLNYLKLLDKKINISVLVRNSKETATRFSFHPNIYDLGVIQSDISLTNSFELEYDFVFHAASLASPKYYGTNPVEVIEPNVFGTSNICKALVSQKKIKSKLLFVSSSEVYGNLPLDISEIDENQFGALDPYQTRSCYAESKRLGETICKSYNHQHGLAVSIVRPFHTYGPGLKLDDGRVFADFVASAVENKNIILNSDGSARRAFCYVSDAVEGIFRVMLLDNKSGAFNIGNSNEAYSVYELAKIIETISNSEKIKVIFSDKVKKDAGYIASKVMSNIPNIQKMSQFFWSPKISAKEGFERTIESFK